MKLLAFIGRRDGQRFRQSEAAAIVGLSEPRLSQLVRQLASEELIEHEVRGRPTVLTAAGRRMLWPYDFG